MKTFATLLLFAAVLAGGCKRDDCGGDNALSMTESRTNLKLVLTDAVTGELLSTYNGRYPPDSMRVTARENGFTNEVFSPTLDTVGDDGFRISYLDGTTQSCKGERSVNPDTRDSFFIALGMAEMDTLVVANTRQRSAQFFYNGILVLERDVFDGGERVLRVSK